MDFGNLETEAISLTENQTARETNDSPSADSPNQDGGLNEPVIVVKAHKKMASKESPRSSVNSLNKFKLQIKKPCHRNGSPLNWLPRQKGDSYLQRKIKQLQEASGMNSTLDETLGTSNPHYCRVLREKIAARQAAVKAMEARKAAMVEASWCRILKAARIQSTEAEALLMKAEKNAAEALEAATAKGVMMYDTLDCPPKSCVIETSSAKGKPSHTVKASFETAFEVDRQVAAAVKAAFVSFVANCPSSLNKDEYIGLLRKISEKPHTDESNQDVSDVTSECQSDGGLEFELGSEDTSFSSQSLNQTDEKMNFRRPRKSQSPQKYDKETLVGIMFERLKCLKEEELASLATIVATCGLNAVLAEMENHRHDQISYANCNSRRISTFGGKRFRSSSMEYFMNGLAGKQQSDVDVPSLDKCLIKHMTKLEREVENARNARKNDCKRGQENPVKSDESNVTDVASSEVKPDIGLGSILVKHSSKLEKEKAELKRKIGQISELHHKELGEERQIGKGGQVKQKVEAVPSLDKFLVKHVSRLEREVQEAKSRRNDSSAQGSMHHFSKKVPSVNQLKENQSLPCTSVECIEKENFNSNENASNNMEQIGGSMEDNEKKGVTAKRVVDTAQQGLAKGEGGLDQILVKHKSKLEREKMTAIQQHDDQKRHTISRQEARERELQEAWGGISLGNSIRPHVSRLERDKAAWLKAEEDRKAAIRNRLVN